MSDDAPWGSDPRIPLHPCCGYPTEGMHAGHARRCPNYSGRLMSGSLPVTTCEQCGRHVDAVEVWYSEARHVHVFIAQCHGHEERTELTDYDRLRSKGLRIAEAAVFRDDLRTGFVLQDGDCGVRTEMIEMDGDTRRRRVGQRRSSASAPSSAS